MKGVHPGQESKDSLGGVKSREKVAYGLFPKPDSYGIQCCLAIALSYYRIMDENLEAIIEVPTHPPRPRTPMTHPGTNAGTAPWNAMSGMLRTMPAAVHLHKHKHYAQQIAIRMRSRHIAVVALSLVFLFALAAVAYPVANDGVETGLTGTADADNGASSPASGRFHDIAGAYVKTSVAQVASKIKQAWADSRNSLAAWFSGFKNSLGSSWQVCVR
ncbi:hypothetical protein SeMB42_g01563 [Synchytrium endobioticum]|uniref:Transmembrane protein n=1 Tax=Synchytrium endobioticum TaxID=286115 RepID=A0A507DMW8_9FUNG|nr:hypothetical protein SeMB42_g01563 [Synchytrium endobioticum]